MNCRPTEAITQAQRRIKPWLYLLVGAAILAACLLLGLRLAPHLTPEVLYWYFSTTAQSVVALLAFVGLIALFRLEQWQRELERLNKVAKETVRRHFGADAFVWTPAETVEKVKEKFADRDVKERPALEVTRRMQALLSSGDVVRTALLLLACLCLPTVGVSLFLILLVPSVAEWWIGGLLAGIVTVGVVGSLASSGWLLYKCWSLPSDSSWPNGYR